ncbi:helix-turn-helix domain-containing protein [Streptomonospora salina]|uniref:DNA-binding XRE family transcriptional regulator n=1 Tax=Streptomonospora salina TaxID=104205 RepID=A0A841E8F5_9ACTN|nr:helix-turn-helix transcriptional regulator [Streptomonospora salina]MBB6000257.1 DNA-binding XRE family transcriptional regulator [Streptomonospora salina]
MAHPYVHVRSPDLFAELIRIADVTRSQLARRAHCSKAHITLISQGKRGCNPRVAWRIANTLGATVDELFTESKEGEPGGGDPTSIVAA